MKLCLFIFFMFAFTHLSAAHFEQIVELTLKVEDQAYNLKIKSVNFNGQEIPLENPNDMFKPRKEIRFKLPPGRYPLTWSTDKGGPKWAETPPKVHERILVLESGDSIVKINIKGDTVSLY